MVEWMTVGGLRLAVQAGGKTGGPLAVVLIHGYPFAKEMWQPQLGPLSDVARVIAYDVRGFGASERGACPLSIDLFVDDLVALLDLLELDRAVIGGLSMGGYVALRMYDRHPHRVRALALCDTRSEADSEEGRRERMETVALIEARGVETFAEDFLKRVFAASSLSRRIDAVQQIRSIILGTDRAALIDGQAALMNRPDTTAVLPRIAVPTLLMVGAEDQLTPPAIMRGMADRIPGAVLHVIPDAGHLSNLENPGSFNRALIAFLQGVGRTS